MSRLFQYHVELPIPTADDITALLSHFTRSFHLPTEFSIERIAKLLTGVRPSVADVKRLCDEAVNHAIREHIKLIEAGKTDIRLQYNTNFSELRFKDKHVFEYWKRFKNVSVGASLDASGARAELMRKGTDWEQVVENRRRMMQEVPHVDFYISATVSSMNVLHILDFHKEWTELGLIRAKDFNINILQDSQWYRTDIFPQWFKDEVITPAYKKHIAWLEPQDDLNRATNGFKSALTFINTKDKTSEWLNFLKETAKLDRIRNESFWDVFPEIKAALTK